MKKPVNVRRMSLSLRDWPAADQAAWARAQQCTDVLDAPGLAAHWRPLTRLHTERWYGRYLSHLVHAEGVELDGTPEDRVTPRLARNYIEILKAEVAPCTVVSLVGGLKMMMRVIAPQNDWRWLTDVCNRLDKLSLPVRKNASKLPSADFIVKRCLNELDRMTRTELKTVADKRRFRDVLMLALTATRPLRLRNLSALKIGTTFVWTGSKWLIKLPGSEMKNGRPYEIFVPEFLSTHLDTYLRISRPAMLRGFATDALWPGQRGGHLDDRSTYCRFIVTSKRVIGVRINPHRLREIAATTLAMDSRSSAMVARPLLGHARFSTTEKHYMQADNIEASRRVNEFMESLIFPSKRRSAK